MWSQTSNQNGMQVMNMFQTDAMTGNGPLNDSGIKKTPWTIDEEQIFCEKHEVLGNKWVEIAKSLSGRNDNSVK